MGCDSSQPVLLLDFNGVIVGELDWEYLDIKEGQERLKNLFDVSFSQKEMSIFGGGKDEEAQKRLQEKYDVPKKDFWNALWTMQSETYIEQLDKDIMEHCDLRVFQSDKEIGIVSNAPKQAIEQVLKHLGVREKVGYISAPENIDEINYVKPSPYLIQQAKQHFENKNFLLIGDSKTDKTAAEKAEVHCKIIDKPRDLKDKL